MYSVLIEPMVHVVEEAVMVIDTGMSHIGFRCVVPGESRA